MTRFAPASARSKVGTNGGSVPILLAVDPLDKSDSLPAPEDFFWLRFRSVGEDLERIRGVGPAYSIKVLFKYNSSNA